MGLHSARTGTKSCHPINQGWCRSEKSQPSLIQGDELDKPLGVPFNPNDYRFSDTDVQSSKSELHGSN